MYRLKWVTIQLIARAIDKPIKGYKRTLTFDEILKHGFGYGE